MANHPFAGKAAIWDNLRSSDKRNYYHKSLLNTSRDLSTKFSPVFFHHMENREISSWSAENFLLNRQRRFARGQKDELPLGQNYAFLCVRVLVTSNGRHSHFCHCHHSYSSMHAIHIITIWYQAIITVHVEKLRAAAIVRFKILVQSKLSSPPTHTYTSSKALPWPWWKSASQGIVTIILKWICDGVYSLTWSFEIWNSLRKLDR